MAPKKCVVNDKKPPKKRVVKPKPPKPVLKTPTTVKVKIRNDLADSTGDPIKYTRILSAQHRIDLANEVALGQLSKDGEKAPPAPNNIKIQVMGRGKRKSLAPTTPAKTNPKVTKNTVLPAPNDILPDSDTDDKSVILPSQSKPAPKRFKKTISPEAPGAPKLNNDEQTPITIKKQILKGKKRGRPKNQVPEMEKMETATLAAEIEELLVAKDETSPEDKTDESALPKKPKTVTPKLTVKKTLSLKKKATPVVKSQATSKSTHKVNGVSPEKQNSTQSTMITRRMKQKVSPKNVSSGSSMIISPTSGLFKNKPSDNAEPITCRKTSVASSNNSCLSWTQDISTSSTTTCLTVNSNDFVRFNKKLPIVQMVNIDDVQANLVAKSEVESVPDTAEKRDTESSSCESDSGDSDSSSSEPTNSSKCEPRLTVGFQSPALSSSSVSTRRDYRADLLEAEMMKLNVALDRLAIEMRSYDMHMIEWIGREPRSKSDSACVGEYLKLFKHESDVIADCRRIDELLPSRNTPSPVTPPPRSVTPAHRPESPARPVTPQTFTAPPRSVSPKPVTPPARPVASPPRPVPPPPRPVSPTPGPVTPPQTMFSDNYAVRPLYTSFEHDDDDALSLFAESITGIETSRLSTATATPAPTPVQEYIPSPVADLPGKYNYRPTEITRLNPVCEKQNADSTSRAAPFLVPPPRVPASALFRECCFHNLVSRCPFGKCIFPHTEPAVEEIKRAASALDETVLQRELALVRCYPSLHRYEEVIVEELKRREPLDRTAALETALQHLNGATDYATVLQRPLGDRWLSDAMLQALSDTQNFSRFKVAFGKLARFAAENNRSVSVAVATKILERVCILPAELDLALAMVDILKLTNPAIYSSDMMGRFEVKLAALDSSLYEEHVEAKARDGAQSLAAPMEPEKRYTSPDTTHYDNMNNPEPVLSRPGDFKLPSYLSYHDKWRLCSGRGRRPSRRPVGRARWHGRPFPRPNVPIRHVTYRALPNKYDRRPQHGF